MQNGCKVSCAQWMRIVFSVIRLELKTSVYEMSVTVMSTVPGCDVTTVQQHYKGSTSTPPRVARLCQIREASLVALRKFPKIYACSHVSIIRLVQSIILVSRGLYWLWKSFVATVPFAKWTRLAQLSTHAKHWSQSVESLTSQRFRSNVTRIHINSKSWMNKNLVWMCFILRLAPCFVTTAHAVLLSALACIRNDSPISFRIACANINSADSAPNAYSSDSPLDKATFTRQEKLINETQCARCAFPRDWFTGPVSVSMSRDVFQGLVQVIRFQCRYGQKEIQFTCSFQISQHFLGTCQICKCWRRKFVWQALCREHQIWSHSGDVLQFSDNCCEQWVLNLITRCRLIVQIQTLLFRQRCHHCIAYCRWTMSKHSSTYLAVGFTHRVHFGARIPGKLRLSPGRCSQWWCTCPRKWHVFSTMPSSRWCRSSVPVTSV